MELTQEVVDQLNKLFETNNTTLLNSVNQALDGRLSEFQEQIDALRNSLPSDGTGDPAGTGDPPAPAGLAAELVAALQAAGVLPSRNADDPSDPPTDPAPDSPGANSGFGDRINSMADTAAEQNAYDATAVRELEREAMRNSMSNEQFEERLRSLAIHPNPVAAPNSTDDPYDFGNVLSYLTSGHADVARYEMEQSAARIQESELSRYGMAPIGGLAVPMEQIIRLSTQGLQDTGDTRGGPAVSEMLEMVYSADIEDPLDLRPYISRLAGSTGEAKFVQWDVPDPASVAEPGDSEYAKTGDAVSDEYKLTPKLLVAKYQLTRVMQSMDATAPVNIFGIGLDKMRRVQAAQMVYGGEANEVTGVYNVANVGSTTVTAAPTTAQVREALRKSWRVPMAQRSIVTSPANVDSWRNLASPAAVARFLEDRESTATVDGKMVLETEHFKSDKPYRGFAGPLREIFLREWDGAVYVSRREQDGLQYIVLELFWNIFIRYPKLFHRFHQA